MPTKPTLAKTPAAPFSVFAAALPDGAADECEPVDVGAFDAPDAGEAPPGADVGAERRCSRARWGHRHQMLAHR